MFPETHLTEVTRLIQLAIAPVFLLTAIGTLIGALSGRLGRVVDRIRALKERMPHLPEEACREPREEMSILGRRMKLVYIAITLAVCSALFVGLLIITAFLDAFLSVDLSRAVGIVFIAAMLSFVASLGVFLREIFLAVTSAYSPMR